ncbi:Glucan endo-1,3-beta-glucosidase, basic isoform [Spatholobus suberectus]|nr:Glucan endo-1,3-beta-glucosidase, basic isoform [Spatholobus suberectus]
MNFYDDAIAEFILPAMQNIYAALASANVESRIIRSYPPSLGAFSTSSSPYIKPIVKFLVKNKAPLLANLYTYFSYIGDTKNIDLSYALFTSPTVVVKDGNYEYRSLFDASLGALYAALENVDAPNLEVIRKDLLKQKGILRSRREKVLERIQTQSIPVNVKITEL